MNPAFSAKSKIDRVLFVWFFLEGGVVGFVAFKKGIYIKFAFRNWHNTGVVVDIHYI